MSLLLLTKLGAGEARRQRGSEPDGASRFRVAEASKGRTPQVEPDNIAISGKNPFVNANPFIAAQFFRRKYHGHIGSAD
jgi:hypothetical protein